MTKKARSKLLQIGLSKLLLALPPEAVVGCGLPLQLVELIQGKAHVPHERRLLHEGIRRLQRAHEGVLLLGPMRVLDVRKLPCMLKAAPKSA